MMEQINRVRPEASIMKILHPVTRHNVEVSEDTGMVAEKENIISLWRRLMGRRARIKEVKGLSREDIWAERMTEQRKISIRLLRACIVNWISYKEGKVNKDEEIFTVFPPALFLRNPVSYGGGQCADNAGNLGPHGVSGV